MSRRTRSAEVDISLLDVHGYKLHANPIADINALETDFQYPFHRIIKSSMSV